MVLYETGLISNSSHEAVTRNVAESRPNVQWSVCNSLTPRLVHAFHGWLSQIYDAFYRLTDPQAQIRSYVYDVVRSEYGATPRYEADGV